MKKSRRPKTQPQPAAPTPATAPAQAAGSPANAAPRQQIAYGAIASTQAQTQKRSLLGGFNA